MALYFLRLLFLAAILAFLVWIAYRALKRPGLRPGNASTPYDVLGVTPDASSEEITAAFRKAVSQYHPDKVAHLGPELRRLAAQKTREILDAYESLRRSRGF